MYSDADAVGTDSVTVVMCDASVLVRVIWGCWS